MIVEGRSDDQSWTGIPFKNIWAAAARLQHVPVLFSSLFCPALLHTLFPFLLTFPLILPFVLLSLLSVGFLTMRPHAPHFFRLITSSPAEFWIQSRNGADAVLLTSTKAWNAVFWLSSFSHRSPALPDALWTTWRKTFMQEEGNLPNWTWLEMRGSVEVFLGFAHLKHNQWSSQF